MSEDNKFFHGDVLKAKQSTEPAATKEYVDDQLAIVHETFSKFGTQLDQRFHEVKESQYDLQSDATTTSNKVMSNKHLVEAAWKEIEALEQKIAKYKRIGMTVGLVLLITIVASLLTGCTSAGTRFIHTSKFPITVMDIDTKKTCTPLVASFERDRYSISYGKPCQVNLVYER